MMFQIGAKLQSQFASAFKGAQGSIASLQAKIESLNKKQGDIAAYQKQQSAIEKTRSKLELLQKQYDNLQAEIGENGNASATLKNQMLSKQQQIERTTASLDTQTKRLDQMGSALEQAGLDTKNLAAESAALASQSAALKQQQDAEAAALQKAAQQMEAEAEEAARLAQQQQEVADSADEMGDSLADAASDLEQLFAAAGVIETLKKGVEILSDCTDASIEFESVMTGVDKTTDLTTSEFQAMSAAVKQLSTDIPATTTELGEVGEVAGQLGIAKNDLLDFTTVMTMLSTATTMAGSEAATMSAQFANITRMDPSKYSNLGSTIVALGNNYATTEQKILDMGQGIAAAGSLAGMSEADMMGLSAAVTSLGIETQAGSTSMSTLITNLNKAVETGEGLNEFASVANMSAAEFTRAWGSDAAGALSQFITGLSDTERNGRSATIILDELGITETRMQRMMLSLATSGDLMNRTLATANTAWAENTALAAEAEKRYATTESKLQMASNAANNLKIAVGDALTPALGAAADASKSMMVPITHFIEANPNLVQGFVVAGGVIGTVTLAVTGYSAAAKVAAAASALLTSSIPGVKTLMLITGGVALLAGGIVALSGAINDASVDFSTLDEEFDSLNEQLQEQERISDLIKEYKKLSGELEGVSSATGSINDEGPVTILVTAEIQNQLASSDFLEGEAVVNLSAIANADIDTEEFLKDGTTTVTLSAEAAEALAAADLLDGTTVQLTGEAAAELTAAGFMAEGQTTVSLTPEMADYLVANDCFADGNLSLPLTPEVLAKLEAADCVDGNTVTLSATALQTLAASGFLLDETVLLSAEAANVLSHDDFVTDPTVKLTAVAAQALAASELLDGTTVTLSGQALAELTAAGFLQDGDTTVTLTPEMAKYLADKDCFADGDMSVSLTPALVETLKAQDCVDVNTISFSAEVTNLADLQSRINTLQSSVSSTKSDLDAASGSLATMQERYSQLEARLANTSKASDKTALQQELEALGTAITEQEANVSTLETTYVELANELAVTQSSAANLAAQEQRLAEIKEELASASGGVITATGNETEVFDQQVESLAALTEAKKAGLRADIYENVTAQASKYAHAVKESNEYAAAMAPLLNQAKIAEQYLGLSAEEVNAEYQGLLAHMDDLAAQPDFNPLGDDAQSTIRQIQDLSSLMGQTFDDLAEYADADISWSDTFDWVGTNEYTWTETIKDLNAEIASYGEGVEEANAVQKAFVNNLVNGLKLGAVSIEEVEALLTNTFSDAENGGEIVASIMEQVQTELALAAENAEDMNTGMGDTAATAAELDAAMSPVLEQMQALGEAYDAAYQSAYESMSGQFELFEMVKTESSISVDEMIASLESQVEYMNTYAENLRKASEMGLSEGLIAQLSDGSTQSAALLATIVSDGTTKIDELNTAFAAVETGKETFASTVAEMETDFSTKMAALETQLTSTVAAMDKSSDAAAAGTATVQAFADAATALAPTVAAAFQAVANKAKGALKINVSATASGISAYASGTDYAERGFALVGEEGPELVWFNGGESVATAEETEAIMRESNLSAQPLTATQSDYRSSDGSVIHIDFSPQYSIGSNTNGDELRSILQEHDENLRDQIENILADIEDDRVRSVYA